MSEIRPDIDPSQISDRDREMMATGANITNSSETQRATAIPRNESKNAKLREEQPFAARREQLKKRVEVLGPFLEHNPQIESTDKSDRLRYAFSGSTVNLLVAVSDELYNVSLSPDDIVTVASQSEIPDTAKRLLATAAAMPNDIDIAIIEPSEDENLHDDEFAYSREDRILLSKIGGKEYYLLHPVDNFVRTLLFSLTQGRKVGSLPNKLLKMNDVLEAMLEFTDSDELSRLVVSRFDVETKAQRQRAKDWRDVGISEDDWERSEREKREASPAYTAGPLEDWLTTDSVAGKLDTNNYPTFFAFLRRIQPQLRETFLS